MGAEELWEFKAFQLLEETSGTVRGIVRIAKVID